MLKTRSQCEEFVPQHMEEAVPCLCHTVAVHLQRDQVCIIIGNFERRERWTVGEAQKPGFMKRGSGLQFSAFRKECKRLSLQLLCVVSHFLIYYLEVRAQVTLLHCSTTGGWCLQLASISLAVFQYGGVGKQRAHANSQTSNRTAINFSASFSATPTEKKKKKD